jgi:hypothetical protein
MKFDCRKIEISDEEFGCSISFADRENESNTEKEMTIDEIITSLGQYILIQRTYSEREFENDYYYYETSDFEKKSGNLKDFRIDLNRYKFKLTCNNELFEIKLNIGDQEFENVKRILKQITNGKGKLNFIDE